MKVYLKKICILIMIIMLSISMFSETFAAGSSGSGSGSGSGTGGSGAFDVTKTFKGSESSDLQGKKEVASVIGGILDAVRIATAAIALIMLTALGIKYMTSSPNDRAEIKKGATVYLVGAFVMFGASTLVTVIKTFSNTNIKP